MKSSNDLLITSIITCINCSYLIKRVTLKTRNILNILIDLKADIAEPPDPINISIKLSITIIASKLFILSLTYSMIPIPNIFKIMSIVKI